MVRENFIQLLYDSPTKFSPLIENLIKGERRILCEHLYWSEGLVAVCKIHSLILKYYKDRKKL